MACFIYPGTLEVVVLSEISDLVMLLWSSDIISGIDTLILPQLKLIHQAVGCRDTERLHYILLDEVTPVLY